MNQADDLVLPRSDDGFVREGRFVTALLTPPSDGEFRRLEFSADIPTGTHLRAQLLDADNHPIRGDVVSGTPLHVRQPVRLDFQFSTRDPHRTPKLHSYSRAFERPLQD